MRFSSAILPPWPRNTPQVSEVLPLPYLNGLSSGDFAPALGQFLGSSAGLSSFVVTKLTETWKAETVAFSSSSGRDTHPTPAPVGVRGPNIRSHAPGRPSRPSAGRRRTADLARRP